MTKPVRSEQPTCPYCHEAMVLGDGSYWCMNKKCAEQFYPSGNDEAAPTPAGEPTKQDLAEFVYCCENGNFGDGHVCAKQSPEGSPPTAEWWQFQYNSLLEYTKQQVATLTKERDALQSQLERVLEVLDECDRKLFEHHEIGFISRAAKLTGSCEICKDGIFGRIQSAKVAALRDPGTETKD